MKLDKLEIWVHDHILKNDTIRHFMYGIYQRVLYAISAKIQVEGDVEVITPDDGYEYLFGYYDKCPWDESGRYMLATRVKSATAKADSTVPADIVTIDLQNNKAVKVLATTHCWNVQQGCMAQWMGADSILYNDFRDGKYRAIILSISTNNERILDMPVYTLSVDKKTALTLDFSRLHRLRPGYGYANVEESSINEACPDKTCIWKIDIESGVVTPLLKYTDFAAFEPREEMKDAEHKVNHLMISPNGKRFMVLHRWFKDKVKYTRLVTCNVDGTGMYNLSDDNFVSHCCWKNDSEILSYLNKNEGGKGYYLMQDKTKEFKQFWPELAMDGHPTYSYDGERVVTDTYPDRKRVQSVYVMKDSVVKRVARVFSPFKYGGDVRCDLHPRWKPDGSQICFDASFLGKRSVCVVNIGTANREPLKNITKISIIIPCYNCASMVEETLQSLQSQTYKDFEVVMVNDGSTDNTREVLEQWRDSSDLNITVVNQENGGVSSARNHGIEVASGEYILFLDSDDIYHEDYVYNLVSAMQDKQYDTVYCRLSRNLNEVRQYVPTGELSHEQTQKEAMDKLLFEMGKYGFYCYLYRKETLRRFAIQFDLNTKFGEDREFNWKYLTHCNSILWLDMPLYGYRINALSATQNSSNWRKTDLLQAVKRVEKYLKDFRCDYSETFNSYMFSRAMWAVAKTFAVTGQKELYDRLHKEYNVRKCMNRTMRDKNKMVAIASIAHQIHPSLFYKLIRFKK